jgi:hypothetical protein
MSADQVQVFHLDFADSVLTADKLLLGNVRMTISTRFVA